MKFIFNVAYIDGMEILFVTLFGFNQKRVLLANVIIQLMFGFKKKA